MPGFSYLVDGLRIFLDWIFTILQGVGLPNYGVAILILTICIRTAVQPLSIKSAKSMREMQEIQPLIKELQERYKGDNQTLNAKVSELYKEHKVNPLMGCLPILIQMPFLIALFWVLKDYNYIREFERFLWLPNLSDPDPLYILPVVVAATTFLQMKLTTAGSASKEQASVQKIMAITMPLFIGYISISFASGLCLYWAFGNFYGITYQFFFNRKADKKKQAKLEAKEKEKPRGELRAEAQREHKAAAKAAKKGGNS